MTKAQCFPGLLEWLAGGERGLSSNQIVTSLTGIEANGKSWRQFAPHHPHDPSDLNRCRMLLESVPALRQLLPKMAGVSPEWAALVAAWDELCTLLDSEAPDWRTNPASRAPQTFKRMCELLEPKGVVTR